MNKKTVGQYGAEYGIVRIQKGMFMGTLNQTNLLSLVMLGIVAVGWFTSKRIHAASNRRFWALVCWTIVCYLLNFLSDAFANYPSFQPFSFIGGELINGAIMISFYRYVSALETERHKQFSRISCGYIAVYLLNAATCITLAVIHRKYEADAAMHAFLERLDSVYIVAYLMIWSSGFLVLIGTALLLRVKFGTKVLLLVSVMIWLGVFLSNENLLMYTGMPVDVTIFSEIGLPMLILFIYFSLASPAEYLDRTTECFNAYAFDLMLKERLQSPKPFVIISVVMDELDGITSRFGHSMGNAIKQSVAKFLLKECEQRDVYVFDSNKFILFARFPELAAELVQKISWRLEEMWDGNGAGFFVKSHVDVLMVPEITNDFDEITRLIRYSAVHATGLVNQIDDKTAAGCKRELEILYLVKNAVKNEAFEVVYQPIYSSEHKGYTSAEALVRLGDCGSLGFVSPEEFIPIAEANGLIMDIGRVVLEKVCRFATAHNLFERGVQYIEVNLSGIQISNSDLPAIIKEMLQKHRIKPNFINFEITETAAGDSSHQIMSNIRNIQGNGSEFSLDDFGTGYSNLSKIAALSFNYIKLDKSLLWSCYDEKASETERNKAYVILESVISMVHRLKMHIIAEGVETPEQAALLVEHGVGYLQGYLFSTPLNEEKYLQFLQDGKVPAFG